MRPAFAILLLVAAAVVAVFAWSAGDPRGVSERLADGDFVDPAALSGAVMDEEVARLLFPALRGAHGRKAYDPVAWVRLAPDHDGSVAIPEASGGRVAMRTNNLGLREDAPTRIAKQGLRVLVVGDSHTEGSVENAQSFANVLEALENAARARHGEPPVEVLNAGVGGTGPHAFLGMVRKSTMLEPDVVVATLYSGNDLVNALTVSDFFTKRASRPRDAAYRERLEAAKELQVQVAQGFNQAYYFRFAPEDVDVAVDETVRVLGSMAELCASRDVRFVVLLLPSKPDVEDDDRETVDRILDMLDMTREEFATNLALTRRVGARLAAAGVTVVDPTDALRAAAAAPGATPLYWRTDHHLDPAGHAIVARVLREALFP